MTDEEIADVRRELTESRPARPGTSKEAAEVILGLMVPHSARRHLVVGCQPNPLLAQSAPGEPIPEDKEPPEPTSPVETPKK